jgi:ACR3 family arsenite transporter
LDISLDGEVGTCAARADPDFRCCPEAKPKEGPKPQLGMERFLTLWILLAVAVGVGVGQIPHFDQVLNASRVGKTNIFTAVGMIFMLLPPCAKIKYDELPSKVRALPKRIGITSVVTNWIVGPLVMFGLGLAFLSHHGDLLQGVIFIGVARCIAMVIIWNAFAGGDQLLCISLVLLNAGITVLAYAPMASALGLLASAAGVRIASRVSFLVVLYNVLIYLCIPLAVGVAMWFVGRRYESYETKFLPRFGPVGLLALLWTVAWMFAEASPKLVSGEFPIGNVALVALPLLFYFVLMFGLTWAFGKYVLKLGRPEVATLAFTAAGNNFELALAATSAVFGGGSPQAVATIVGPLMEIPVMLLLVKVSSYLN